MAAACGPSGHGKGVQLTDHHGTPVVLPYSEAKLLAGGDEPRAPLRYRIVSGQREALVLELTTDLKLAIGDMSPPVVRSPTVRLTMEVEALSVRPELSLQGKIAKVEVPDDPAIPANVTTAVRSDLERLAGSSWSALFSDCGRPERVSLAAPAEANNQLLATLDRVREALTMLLPPLPDAPVGKNARWQVHRKRTVGPAHVEETALYKLGAADEQPRLTVTLGMSAAEQALEMPGTPPGSTVALSSFEGGGKGQIELELGRIVQPASIRWSALGRGTARPGNEPPAPITLTVEASNVVRRR
jgi:hypothetical protein